MAGREGWKTASAERVDKPEQKRRREGDKHIHTEAETTEPRIEAAITTGNHAGSSGGSPRIRRTPTQPGIGSTSPDTVFARSLSALETEAVILPPLLLALRTLIWGVRDPSHTHGWHEKHQSPGGS